MTKERYMALADFQNLWTNTIKPQIPTIAGATDKADKSATVSTVSYDGTNKKLTKTINGTTTDIVSASTLKTDMGLKKSDVGLGNVTNDAQVKRTEMGAASGVATLGSDGKVPSSQLPSYVDDVIDLLNVTGTAPFACAKDDRYYNTSSNKIFTATAANTWGTTGETPESSKIYINLANDKTYRWSGSAMVEINSSDVVGIKVGSSGSTLTPSQGVITIPAYETNADVTDAENVKAALGTNSTHGGAFLRKDGTWVVPTDNNTTYSLGVGTGDDANKIVLTPSSGTANKITVPYATNAGKVNGKTVAENVPSGAKFTDTTYESKTAASGGTAVSLVTTGEKYTWNGKQDALTFNSTPSSSNKVATMADIPIRSITTASGSDIATPGTPSVDVSTSGTTTTLTFHKLKGEKGDPGTNGTNGTSCTHSWSGTTLTVTSASGTSSANLKGAKGDDGLTTAISVNGTTYTQSSGTITLPNYPSVPVSSVAGKTGAVTLAYPDIGYTVNAVSNSSTTVSLAGTTPLHIVTTSVSITAVTLSANPAEGHSCHVIFANSGSSDLTVDMTHDSINRVCPGGTDPDPLTIPAGGYVEIDFLTANSKVYVRGV